MSNTIVSSDANKNGQKIQDPDGNHRIYLLNSTGATVALGAVAKKGYDATNNVIAAIAVADSSTAYDEVLVAAEAITTATRGWWYYEGSGITMTPVADTTYTADDGLKMHNGTVTDTTAAAAYGASEFGAVETGGDTTTSLVVTLFGRSVLNTT